MKKTILIIFTILVVIFLFIIAKIGYAKYIDHHPVNVNQYRSDIHSKKAKNHITIFYDLKCSDCKKLHQDVLNSPEFNQLLKEKDASVKLVPHPILSNNGLSNRFANMADSVNSIVGMGSYDKFIDLSYNNMNETDPMKIVKKLKLGHDVEKQIKDDYENKSINKYKNKEKQSSEFNITETPTVYINDNKINFNHLRDEVMNLK